MVLDSGADIERSALVRQQIRDPNLSFEVTLFKNGLPNECFFNIVLISINVSNFGMLRTTIFMSFSQICI